MPTVRELTEGLDTSHPVAMARTTVDEVQAELESAYMKPRRSNKDKEVREAAVELNFHPQRDILQYFKL